MAIDKRYGVPGGELTFSYLFVANGEEAIVYARNMVEALSTWRRYEPKEPYSVRQMSDNE